jgi:amino acid adenylation domain-containing protein
MMDSHSQITSPPTLHLFREVVARTDVLAQSPPERVTTLFNGHLRHRLAQYFDIEIVEQVMRRAHQTSPVSVPNMIRETCDALCDISGKPHIFLKENCISHVGAQLLDIFPNARFVFQTRDPRDYLSSAIKMRKQRLGNKFGSLRNAMDLWAQDQTFGLRLLGQLGKDRVFFQRYEDLITDPESVLSDLCEFVGVEFDSNMLQFYDGKAAKKMADANAAIALLAKPVVAGNFNKFADVLSPRHVKRVEAMVGSLMDQFGYARAYTIEETSRRRHISAVSLTEPFERLANSIWSPFYCLQSKWYHGELTSMTQPIVANYTLEKDVNKDTKKEQPAGVAQRLLRAARTHASRPAIKIGGMILTYEQLFGMAQRVAHTLRDTFGAEMPSVGIYVERNLATYVSILGVILAGGCYIPLNPRLPLQRNRLIVTEAEVEHVLYGEVSESSVDQLIDAMPDVTTHMVVPGAQPALTQFVAPQIRPDQDAYILFTSGSTGTPKGVQITQANLEAYLDEVITILAPSPESRFSQCFDLAFDPSIHDIFVSLCCGSLLCVPSQSHLLAPTDYIQSNEITHLFAVPSLMYTQRRADGLAHRQFPKLAVTLFGGEPLSEELVKEWQKAAPNSRIENWYGPTEATIACTRHVWTGEFQESIVRHVPIGKPFMNTCALVLNENHIEVPAGSTGQLFIGGAQVAKGYVNDPVRTAERFLPLPGQDGMFFNTGDIVKLQDGNLHFVGRDDGQVKIRGHRGEIAEVEAILHSMAKGHNVIATAWPHESANPTHVVGAIERMGPDLKLDWGILRERLPDYMVPANIVSLEHFARGASGKIDRKAVCSQIADKLKAASKMKPDAPSMNGTDFATQVLDIIMTIKPSLDRYRVRTAPSLLWAGLDSLDFVNLTVEIENDLDIPLDANKVSEMADKSFVEFVNFLQVLLPTPGKKPVPVAPTSLAAPTVHIPARMNRSAEFIRAFPDILKEARAPLVIVVGQSGVYRGFSAKEAESYAKAKGTPITALNLGLPGLNVNGVQRMCKFLRDTCLDLNIAPLAVVYELDPMGVSLTPPTHDLDLDESVFSLSETTPDGGRPAGDFRWDLATNGDLKFNKAKWDELRQPKWERQRDHTIWEYYNGTLEFDPVRVDSWLKGARVLAEMPTRIVGLVHPVRAGIPPNAKETGPLFEDLLEQVRSEPKVELMAPDDFVLEDVDFFNVNHVEVGHGRTKLTHQVINKVLE